MSRPAYDATIVGSGFAGSLLARLLAMAGWKVLLVERYRHPRFAIGESSTPLANLALERMGRRYECDDLVALAAHGRWLEAYPHVGRGLKRGFSFYRQTPETPFVARSDNRNRLLVAASPNDYIADTQWLRSDVDQFFFERAREAGVEALQEVELDGARSTGSGFALTGSRDGERLKIGSSLLIDASGAGGFLRRTLPIEDGRSLKTSSSLLFGHFSAVPCLREVCAGTAAAWEAPYPEDWAAVHHLLDEGWMYLLRFDSGLVSAGILLEGGAGPQVGELPADAWGRIVSRYPTLAALFAPARAERPVAFGGPLQRRLARAHGPGWVVLPYTYGFVDPLYSTGIAWSLLGVERLADTLIRLAPGHPTIATGTAFDSYAALLALELEQVDLLVSAAYRARLSFELFAAHSMLYFALVSFEEASQRLGDEAEPWWRGFLGAASARGELLEEAAARLGGVLSDAAEASDYATWVRRAIEPINVAGLAREERRNLYPVDLEDLVVAAPKLGLTSERIEAAVPMLRGRAEA